MRRSAGASAGELQGALERAWKIPGLFRREEGEFLYRLARRRGNLVELGCWMGRSTAILVQAAAVWGAQVTSVDAFSQMPKGWRSATAEHWRAHLKGVGLEPPELLAMTSDAAAETYPAEREIALLFIDANHERDFVARDLAHWTPRVKAGGVVALHDMFFPSIRGVAEAVVEWWRGDVWELVGMRDFTVAFRRMRDEG